MRWTSRSTVLLSGVGLSAAMLLAGCSSDSTSPGSPELSVSAAADAGAASQDEMEQATESFTVAGALDPAGATFSAASLSAGSPDFSSSFLQNCASLSSETDTDGDGAPDNAVFTFALPACHFESFRGGTLDLTGTITLSDPTPSAADFAWHAALADYTFKVTNAQSETFTAVRNGTRDLTGNAAGLTLANNITTVRTASGHPSIQVTHNLQLDFTPAAGGTLAQGSPLPSGTISSTGTLTFVRGADSRTFTVTTPTPLQYDATCAGPRRARIRAGEVRWTLPSGAYVSVVWTACGVRPTRTFVPAG
jgi:hypothetical protein